MTGYPFRLIAAAIVDLPKPDSPRKMRPRIRPDRARVQDERSSSVEQETQHRGHQIDSQPAGFDARQGSM